MFQSTAFTVTEDCLDYNNHVNFSVYISLVFLALRNAEENGFIMDSVSGKRLLKRLLIFYEGEGSLGETLTTAVWEDRNISSCDKIFYFSVTNDDHKVLSHACLVYGQSEPHSML